MGKYEIKCLDSVLFAAGPRVGSWPRRQTSGVPKILVIKINNFFLYTFIFLNFWLHWVFVAVRGLSLVAASGGYSSLRCAGFSLRWLLLLWSTGSR